MPSPSTFPFPCSPASQPPVSAPIDSEPAPLSAEELAALDADIRSAKEKPSVYLGTFAQYADDE